MVVVDQGQSGQTVNLPLGQVIELRLAENPTTGYRWAFVTDGAPACAVVGDRFESGSATPGQGGEHSWTIKGVQPGTCGIAMQYRRSFQPDAPARLFELQVGVTR